jgi:hypothetical protein
MKHGDSTVWSRDESLESVVKPFHITVKNAYIVSFYFINYKPYTAVQTIDTDFTHQVGFLKKKKPQDASFYEWRVLKM